MPFGNRNLGQDLGLRAMGLLLLAIGALAMRHLFAGAPVPHRHVASAAEMALAAIGFLGLSLGAPLLLLGAHLFDEVELSERWRRRPVPVGRRDRRMATDVLRNGAPDPGSA